MKIALGCDHGGYAMKEDIKKQLEGLGHEVKDCGTYSTESCDYPIFGEAAARAVASGECEYGIVVCTTGIGISIAANKVKGIRCAHCADTLEAQLCRQHNNANMMAIGAVDALQDARLRVPKDVSVIGCDNIFYSGIRRVSLTTIDHFVDLKGRDACDIIIRKIDTGIRFGEGIRHTSVYNIEYNPKIIVRKTTGYARMDKPDPINEKSEENKFK